MLLIDSFNRTADSPAQILEDGFVLLQIGAQHAECALNNNKVAWKQCSQLNILCKQRTF